jgi:hypothetical protein
MNCNEIRELFSEYYDSECGVSDAVTAHLKICEDCVDGYAAYKNLFDEIRAIPQPELPDGFHEKMMAAVKSAKNKKDSFSMNARVWIKAGSVMAAGIIIFSLLASGIASFFTVSPEPQAYEVPVLETYTIEWAGRLVFAGRGIIYDSKFQNTATMLAAEYYEQRYVIHIRVDDLNQAANHLNELNGYNLHSHVFYNDYGSNGQYERRVGINEYTQTKEALRGLGDVVSEMENVYKRADEAADLEARLKAKEEETSRLLSLLGESRTMDVLTLVERQLSMAENERDNIRGQLNQIYGVCAQPYMTIYLFESAPEPVAMAVQPFSERLGQRFVRSLNTFIRFMEGIAVWFSGAVVPLVLLGVISGMVYLIIQKRRKGHE